jgi:GTPase SAR1 family protein
VGVEVIYSMGSLDDQIVLMGMSCVGKTTFASVLKERGYAVSHFDAQYTYNLTGLAGVSRIKNWARIIRGCEGKFVLDNWTTEDKLGQVLYEAKPDACIYVLYDLYPNILDRYRVPVTGEDAHFMMYKKMYSEVPFEDYKRVRFFRVHGQTYDEYTVGEFREFIGKTMDPWHGRYFNTKTWTWDKNVPKL